MTSVDGSAFANQLMYFSNPKIASYSSHEFDDPTNVTVAPISHIMSAEAYKKPEDRRRNIAGFTYQKNLSNSRQAVWKHKADKRVVVANKGTDAFGDPMYLLQDAQLTIGQGRKNPIYKQAISNYQKVQDTFGPDHKYHLTGHSAGAWLSDQTHRRFHKSTSSSVLFNTPGSIQGVVSSGVQKVYQTPSQKAMDKNSTSFISKADPVSIFARHRKNTKNKRVYGWNPHDLSHWGDREYYNPL
jgi:hypothetical protein